jgi:hypothetical protein
MENSKSRRSDQVPKHTKVNNQTGSDPHQLELDFTISAPLSREYKTKIVRGINPDWDLYRDIRFILKIDEGGI